MVHAGLASIALVCWAGAANADGIARIGNFALNQEKDRFGDQDTAIATVMHGTEALAVRCLFGHLSLAYLDGRAGQGRWEEGLSASIKLKVDRGPTLETTGAGVNDRLIEIPLSDDTARSFLGADEIALRIAAKDVVSDHIFALKQSRKALEPVLVACHTSLTASGGTDGAASTNSMSDKAKLEKLLGHKLDEPPSSPTVPAASATLATPVVESADKVAAVFAAGVMCGMTIRTDVLSTAIAGTMPAGVTISGRDFVLAVGRVQSQQLDQIKGWSSKSTEVQKAFCADARTQYGSGGSLIAGALE